MRKKNIFISTLLSTFAVQSALNLLIFHNAKLKINKIDGNFFKWKYGKIFYTVKGEGSPVLMVHGIGAGSDCFEWHRNIDVLSKYHQVYAIDLLGFGKSDKPNMTYTAYMYSQLIESFIKEIVKEKVYIVASSLSAAFTVMSCSLNPTLFKKLLLICPTGVGEINTKFNNNDFILREIINMPLIGTTLYNVMTTKKSCKKFLTDNIFYSQSNLTDEILNHYYYSAHYSNSNAKYAIASFAANYMNTNIENNISKLEIPIYVVWGKEAKLSPIENLDRIKDLNPNIDYAIFDRVKLMPHIENAREFNNICKEFFEGE